MNLQLKCFKTSNNGGVKVLDRIESVDPFNLSCSAEIFELQHVRFWLGILCSFFQLLLMPEVCKKEVGQSLHNTNHVTDTQLRK